MLGKLAKDPVCGLLIASIRAKDPACGLLIASIRAKDPACGLLIASIRAKDPACGLLVAPSCRDSPAYCPLIVLIYNDEATDAIAGLTFASYTLGLA